MSLVLYGHPFSSYCQKVRTALYEHALQFDYRVIGSDPDTTSEWAAHWPFKKMPVLVDDGKVVAESTVIIEHLHIHHPKATRLLPSDPVAALDVRFMDRFFDMHIMSPMQKAVFSAIAQPEAKEEARAAAAPALETGYAWLEHRLGGNTWAAGETFSMADCAAAPALFYADWVHEIPEYYPTVKAYRQRLLARPSYARAVEEARPYRGNFPLGAPDRD